jgi:hypothetical protein
MQVSENYTSNPGEECLSSSTSLSCTTLAQKPNNYTYYRRNKQVIVTKQLCLFLQAGLLPILNEYNQRLTPIFIDSAKCYNPST